MTTIARSAALLLCLSAPLVACSSEDPAPKTGYQKFAEDFAEDYCSLVGNCCGSAQIGSCKASVLALLAERGEAIESGKADFHEDAATACLAAIPGHLGSCQPPPNEDEPPVCRNVVAGKILPGAPCSMSEECASGSVCSYGPVGSPYPGGPVCEEREPAAIGAPCLSGCETAQLVCDPGTNTCAEPSQLGEACDTVPCAAQLHCDAEAGLTCQPMRALGQPCSGYDCETGAYCDNAVCVPQKDEGSPCSGINSFECTSACDPDSLNCEGPVLCSF